MAADGQGRLPTIGLVEGVWGLDGFKGVNARAALGVPEGLLAFNRGCVTVRGETLDRSYFRSNLVASVNPGGAVRVPTFVSPWYTFTACFAEPGLNTT